MQWQRLDSPVVGSARSLCYSGACGDSGIFGVCIRTGLPGDGDVHSCKSVLRLIAMPESRAVARLRHHDGRWRDTASRQSCVNSSRIRALVAKAGLVQRTAARCLSRRCRSPYIESRRQVMTMSDRAHEQGMDWSSRRPNRRLKRPPLYQVVLLNDDYTPMEFVVDVLEHIFGMDRTTATRVMLEVHTRGQGRLRRLHLRDRGDQGRAGHHLRPAAPASAPVHDGRGLKSRVEQRTRNLPERGLPGGA